MGHELAICMGGACVFVTTRGGMKKKAPPCIHPSPRQEPLCGWVLYCMGKYHIMEGIRPWRDRDQ